MKVTRKVTLSIALATFVFLSVLLVSTNCMTISSVSAQTSLTADPASTKITGVISAVESGTTAASSWSVGPLPDPMNSSVSVDIRIDGATPKTIWSWAVNSVTWSPSVLKLTKVTQGNFLTDSGDQTLMIGTTPSLWNNAVGAIDGGLACTDSTSNTAQTKDTSGVLATLTFNVVGYGQASINLADAVVYSSGSAQVGTTGTPMTANNATVTVIQPPPASIQVFTNRGGTSVNASGGVYGPQDLVQMYALVTYNHASVAGQEVGFSVQNSNGTIVAVRVAETNDSGIANANFRMPLPSQNSNETGFGTWSITGSVNVTQITLTETTTFTFGYFSSVSKIQVPASVQAGENLPVQITINNLSNQTMWSELDVTLFDQAQIPIGSYTTTNTQPTQNQTVTATINIPETAFPGQAAAYVCLLSANGTAMASENVANFQILPSTASEAVNSFAMPEYAWGSLIALLAAFAAFVAFRVVKKGHQSSL